MFPLTCSRNGGPGNTRQWADVGLTLGACASGVRACTRISRHLIRVVAQVCKNSDEPRDVVFALHDPGWAVALKLVSVEIVKLKVTSADIAFRGPLRRLLFMGVNRLQPVLLLLKVLDHLVRPAISPFGLWVEHRVFAFAHATTQAQQDGLGDVTDAAYNSFAVATARV